MPGDGRRGELTRLIYVRSLIRSNEKCAADIGNIEKLRRYPEYSYYVEIFRIVSAWAAEITNPNNAADTIISTPCHGAWSRPESTPSAPIAFV